MKYSHSEGNIDPGLSCQQLLAFDVGLGTHDGQDVFNSFMGENCTHIASEKARACRFIVEVSSFEYVEMAGSEPLEVAAMQIVPQV